jgi:hypothetical protein
VGGAVGGSLLGAEVGTRFPHLWGTPGTMLGIALVCGAWGLLAPLGRFHPKEADPSSGDRDWAVTP